MNIIQIVCMRSCSDFRCSYGIHQCSCNDKNETIWKWRKETMAIWKRIRKHQSHLNEQKKIISIYIIAVVCSFSFLCFQFSIHCFPMHNFLFVLQVYALCVCKRLGRKRFFFKKRWLSSLFSSSLLFNLASNRKCGISFSSDRLPLFSSLFILATKLFHHHPIPFSKLNC